MRSSRRPGSRRRKRDRRTNSAEGPASDPADIGAAIEVLAPVRERDADRHGGVNRAVAGDAYRLAGILTGRPYALFDWNVSEGRVRRIRHEVRTDYTNLLTVNETRRSREVECRRNHWSGGSGERQSQPSEQRIAEPSVDS